MAATGAEASLAMVPPNGVLAAVEEALRAGIRLIVTVAEGVPVHDAIAIGRIVIGRLTASRVRLHSVGIDDLTIRRLRVIESEPDDWYAQEK